MTRCRRAAAGSLWACCGWVGRVDGGLKGREGGKVASVISVKVEAV